jgi:two-component system KDP operon response regulator KdpE
MTDEFTVLLIEDDRYISNFIAVSLKKEGYRVTVAESVAEGLFLFTSNHPDMVLLDLGLPDRDGLEVIREIRGFSSTPILVVSAREQEKDKIGALDLGADDYITKPFHMGELLARIRVVKRKLQQRLAPLSLSVFSCDYLTVDYEKRKVLVDGNEVHLTPMEYKLLLLMITNKGKVLTHNYIVREIWGYGETGDTKTVRVFMANLRRKIEKNITKPRFILTEIGVGYRFADE